MVIKMGEEKGSIDFQNIGIPPHNYSVITQIIT
jgi:hypothetical protein